MRLPAPSPPWFLRPLHWWQRRKHGDILQPTALWSYRPRAMLAFLAMFAAVRRPRAPVPLALRTLVAIRVSQLNTCGFCVDLNAAMLEAEGVPAEKALSLPGWRDDPAYTQAERVALEYAEAMTRTPPAVDDALFARLRAGFAPEAIVELTAGIALQNLSARFNAALGVQSQGFCRRPASTPPSGDGASQTPAIHP